MGRRTRDDGYRDGSLSRVVDLLGADELEEGEMRMVWVDGSDPVLVIHVNGEFQALQHRSAHLFSEIEIARAAVMGALTALDSDRPDAALRVSVAKAKAGRVAELAVQEAVQMHGGVGMTDEFDVGLFMKRVRVLNELLGDAGFHQERMARSQGF